MAGELRLGATVPALIDCLADQRSRPERGWN
jgi:hypothetical protein